MATSVNKPGERKALSLIAAGKYDMTSSWSFDAADGDKLLGGADGEDWAGYAQWFLGEDTGATEKTKDRYKYPFGKDGKVYRRAVSAIRQRASQNSDTAVYDAAGRLMDAMDAKEGEGEQQPATELQVREAATLSRLSPDACLLQRFAVGAMQPQTLDPEARTVDMTFSTGAAVRRRDYRNGNDYDEVLDISPQSIRMDRLNNGAPLLDSHRGYSLDGVIGAVVPGSARIEKGELRGKVKFSQNPDADAVFRDVQAGIVRNASLGYVTHKQEIDDTQSPPVYRATDWEPYEVSACPMGADPGAGFRSVVTPRAMPATEERASMTATPAAAQPATNEPNPAVNERALREQAVKDERARIAGIEQIGKRLNLAPEFVALHRASGTELNDFRGLAIDEVAKAAEANRAAAGGNTDASAVQAPAVRTDKFKDPEKGIMAARFVRALAASRGDPENAVKFARTVWHDDFTARALAAGIGASGGFLIPEQYSNEVIELLRPMAVVRSLNPRIVPMPGGNMNMPRLNAASSANYVGENAVNNASQQTFGNVKLTEKKLLAIVPISNDLIKFASPAADEVVRDDMVAQIAVAEDSAFIRGIGSQFSPKGLRYWAPSANLIASTGATNALITADLISLMSQLELANVRMIRPGWIMSPRSKNAIMAIQSTTGQFVYRDEMMKGTLWGYPFRVTTNVPTNLSGTNSEIYLADFFDVVIGEVPGLEIEVSREAAYNDGTGTMVAAFTQDQTVIRVIERHDFAMRHDNSVAVLTGVSY